jgi:hypothetical protein
VAAVAAEPGDPPPPSGCPMIAPPAPLGDAVVADGGVAPFPKGRPTEPPPLGAAVLAVPPSGEPTAEIPVVGLLAVDAAAVVADASLGGAAAAVVTAAVVPRGPPTT